MMLKNKHKIGDQVRIEECPPDLQEQEVGQWWPTALVPIELEMNGDRGGLPVPGG